MVCRAWFGHNVLFIHGHVLLYGARGDPPSTGSLGTNKVWVDANDVLYVVVSRASRVLKHRLDCTCASWGGVNPMPLTKSTLDAMLMY